MTFVSKKGLAFMGFLLIESEIGRIRPLHFAELLERLFSGSIASDPEIAFSCNLNFDLVSFFDIESFDDERAYAVSHDVPLPRSEVSAYSVLALPVYNDMTEDECDGIVQAFLEVRHAAPRVKHAFR